MRVLPQGKVPCGTVVSSQDLSAGGWHFLQERHLRLDVRPKEFKDHQVFLPQVFNDVRLGRLGVGQDQFILVEIPCLDGLPGIAAVSLPYQQGIYPGFLAGIPAPRFNHQALP